MRGIRAKQLRRLAEGWGERKPQRYIRKNGALRLNLNCIRSIYRGFKTLYKATGEIPAKPKQKEA